MKRIVILLSILVTIICLLGCSQDASVQTGTLEISINSDVSRGIQAVSMETASYNVTVKDSSENIVFSSSGKTQTTYTVSVLAGTYTAYVEALNSDGDVIGTGSSILAVVAGQVNSFSITVSEVTGNGIFSISITANEGYPLSYSIKRADGTEVKGGSLSYSSGSYTASEVLANGFYVFTITRTDTNKVLKTDAIRIVKDKAVSYSATFQFLTDGTIVIVNEISGTPTIDISINKATFNAGDMLKASAVISDIDEGYTCFWLIDGVAVTEAGAYEDLSYEIPESDETEHEVALVTRKGSIIWSDSVFFSVKDSIIEGFPVYGIPTGIEFSPETVFVGSGGTIEGSGFDGLYDGEYIYLYDYSIEGYDHGYLFRYPKVIETWYQRKFGNFNPASGNSFSGYVYYYYNIPYSDHSYYDLLVDHVLKDGFMIIPENTNEDNWEWPYLSADYQSINDTGLFVGYHIQRTDSYNSHYTRDYPDINGDVFTETNQIFMDIVTNGTDYKYYLLFPAEVLTEYLKTNPNNENDNAAVNWYMKKYYGIEDFDSLLYEEGSITVIKNALVSNGYINPAQTVPETPTTGRFFNIGYVDPDFDPENSTMWYVDAADCDSFEIRMGDNGYASIYYPSILDTYFRSVYGWFPNTGNPFHFYYQDQLGMTEVEFLRALAERSVELPYPDYIPSYSHPYILTDSESIPDDLTISEIQSIYDEDKGYYKALETETVFEFTESNQIYVGLTKWTSGRKTYMLLVPEEVINYYRNHHSELSYEEKFALYFEEKYGIDVMTNDGDLLFTREQIATVLSEYRSPNED